ncbi:AAA family ATPase [Sphingopyxis terrae]|uniref:AAA family ATPase n=1 Tax=Sphingopyxis terrae TaxID=33052 RepID=UPI003F7DFEBF
MTNKKRPSEVFTPRAAQVNASMYVRRPLLEERLIDAFDSNKYIVVHGESGNGKTWLYKRVFAENDIHFDVVNLSSVASAGSIEGALLQKLASIGFRVQSKTETTSTAGVRPWNVGVDWQNKIISENIGTSPFHLLLKHTRDQARGSRAALVLDNFESIVGDDAALKQLAGLIISADDESVAQFGVQVLIVGVPGNLKETVSKLTNSAPVANRLTEIPEVARMSDDESKDLIHRGLIDELELSIIPEISESLYGDICWMTDRIAQHIHELCLIIANNARRNNDIIDIDVLNKSVQTWMEDSLSADMATIEAAMNARETKVGRKNQCLFALGQCRSEDFKPADIELILKEHFDIGDATLNVSQILSGFADEDNPIIRRTPKADAWRFVSPKLKMAIRAKLQKKDDKVVVRS